MRHRRHNPPLPPIDRRQSMAVDHVAKFVADEFVIEPRAFLRLGALGRVYHDWCEVHGVMNRRVSANELLLRLERDHGLTTGTIYLPVFDSGEPGGQVYALRGARLRDPALNARSAQGGVGPAWRPIGEGEVSDAGRVIERARERNRLKSREYYAKRKDELRAKRNAAKQERK